jgi:integrase
LLTKILASAPKTALTVLVNSRGRPWRTANALAQAFGKEVKRLRLSGCVFHGLRKTACVTLAEAGCTMRQISAVTGQSGQMVDHYTKMADREALAAAAFAKVCEASAK